jgi:hypothetical protein
MGHREQTLIIPQIANIPVKDAEGEEEREESKEESKEKERIGTMPDRPSVKVKLHPADTKPDAKQDRTSRSRQAAPAPIYDPDTDEQVLELPELPELPEHEMGVDEPTPVVTRFQGPPPPPPLPPLLPLPLFAPLPAAKDAAPADNEDEADDLELFDEITSDEITWIYRRRSG